MGAWPRYLLVETGNLGLRGGALGAKRAQRGTELPDEVSIVACQLLHACLQLLPLQRQLSRRPAKPSTHASSAPCLGPPWKVKPPDALHLMRYYPYDMCFVMLHPMTKRQVHELQVR